MGIGYSFTVPGEPVAKGRARSFVRNGRVGHFTPEKTAVFENLVRLAAQSATAGAKPISGAVALSVRAFFGIPASWSKKRHSEALNGFVHVTKRPDLDNVIKAVKDGMNGVVWVDDSQVVILDGCSKSYSDRPRVEVVVVEV